MKIDLTIKNFEANEDIKKYLQRKVAKLERRIPKHARKSAHAQAILKGEKGKRTNPFTAEITLHLPHGEINAKEATVNMFAAIDLVQAKLLHQLEKYKEKATDHKSPRRGVLRRFRERADRDFRGRQN